MINDDSKNLLNNEKTKRQIQIKQKLSQRNQDIGNFDHQNGLPPGNKLASNWIVLDLGVKPNANEYNLWEAGENWSIKFFGVQADTTTYKEVSVREIIQLGLQDYACDWHCVTGWTAPSVKFQGVPLPLLLDLVQPQHDWVCLYQVGADSYTVNVHRDDLSDAFLAIYDENGDYLSHEHGGVRIVFPSLFGWKSAKWLTEVHFLKRQKDGFWEKLYCHPRGRVEFNERWHQKAKGVWETLIWMLSWYDVVLPREYVVKLMQVSGAVLGWFTLRINYLQKSGNNKQD
eukprot:TRINITY_DN920_c0_g1_i10.p2 TRINITY_DN920_c0_g1~~TRINITY_DN920_c0_g1_i10.p2  ORF type:complete len:286 (-),score=37.54 TRINITY_DN920_c0_g1_i10:930-1787(-)